MRICERIEEWLEEKIEKPLEGVSRQEKGKLLTFLVKVMEWVVETVRTKIIRVVCRAVEMAWAFLKVIPTLIYDLGKNPRRTLDNLGELIKSPFTPFCPTVRVPPLNPILMISHHGACRAFPENTLKALWWALEQGANALEIDVCMTQDGHVVAWHDWDPDGKVSLVRQLGLHPDSLYKPDVPALGSEWRRPVGSLTLAELRASHGYQAIDGRDYSGQAPPLGTPEPDVPTFYIPTLPEVLAFIAGFRSLRALILDIKIPDPDCERAPEMLDRIHADLAAVRPPYDVALLVPAARVLKAMKDHDKAQNYCLPFSYDVEFPPGVIINIEDYSAVDQAIELGNDIASVGKPAAVTLLPWKTYTRVLAYDLPQWAKIRNTTGGWGAPGLIRWYLAWTLNDPAELTCLCDLGVSGIITDDIPLLKKISQARGRL